MLQPPEPVVGFRYVLKEAGMSTGAKRSRCYNVQLGSCPVINVSENVNPKSNIAVGATEGRGTRMKGASYRLYTVCRIAPDLSWFRFRLNWSPRDMNT